MQNYATFYNHSAVGVPSAFEEECIKCGDRNCDNNGLIQAFDVTGRDVNTLNALRSVALNNENPH